MTLPIAAEAVVAMFFFQGSIISELSCNLGQQGLHVPMTRRYPNSLVVAFEG